MSVCPLPTSSYYVILQRFHLWSLNWVRCKMLDKASLLGRKSKWLSMYTGLVWPYTWRWWDWSGNVAILPVWAVCRRRLCAQMALLWSFHHAFSDLFRIFLRGSARPRCGPAWPQPSVQSSCFTILFYAPIMASAHGATLFNPSGALTICFVLFVTAGRRHGRGMSNKRLKKKLY